jgi:hypothetical protein
MNESRSRPYAPGGTVTGLLQRFRTRNLPDVVDGGFLNQLGMSKEISTRVLSTLRFLKLISDAGQPTDVLRSLARSTDEEYAQILEGIVRDAYRDVFTAFDPSQDSQDRALNAFRRYEPGSQTYRMATLFLALVKEAGIPLLDEPRKRASSLMPQKVRASRPLRTPARPRGGQKNRQQKPQENVETARAQGSAVLWGYFKRLPAPGGTFSSSDRERWLAGVRAAFDLEYVDHLEEEETGEE